MKKREINRKLKSQIVKLDKALALYCSEVEASKITGYSTAWLRKHRTPSTHGTPIVKICPGGTLYLIESLENIRKPEEETVH